MGESFLPVIVESPGRVRGSLFTIDTTYNTCKYSLRLETETTQQLEPNLLLISP